MKGKTFHPRTSHIHKKKKFILLLLLIFGLFFFFYQFVLVFLLDNSQSQEYKTKSHSHEDNIIDWEIKTQNHNTEIRGIRHIDSVMYTPDDDGMFTCIESKVKIPFSYVNDDYCDCIADGSDEPGTNACDNGFFFCATQLIQFAGQSKPQKIPSYKVNDGICDCCDGSDEWNQSVLINIPTSLKTDLAKYVTPCVNRCAVSHKL